MIGRIAKFFIFTLLTLMLVYLIAGQIWPDEMARFLIGLEKSRAGLADRRLGAPAVKEGAPDVSWRVLISDKTEGNAPKKGRPKLVLLHGFGGSSENWLRLAGSLRGAYDILAPDLPGFGDTPFEPEKRNYDLPSQARRVLSLTRKLGWNQFHVVGNSMGGHIATWVTHLAGEFDIKIQSLILIASGGLTSATATEFKKKAMANPDENPLIIKQPGQFAETQKLVFETPPFLPGVVEQYFARRQVARAGQYRQLYQAAFVGDTAAPTEPFLAEIQVPVLIIWGKRDRVLHPDGALIFESKLSASPRKRLALLEECGHLPMLEKPSRTAREIHEFIQIPAD